MSLLIPAMWAIIRFFHAAAHLTLVTSGVMAKELAAQVGEGDDGTHHVRAGAALVDGKRTIGNDE